MFRSVFAKYVMMFLLVFALSFAILFFVISAVIENYSVTMKAEVVEEATAGAANYVKMLAFYEGSDSLTTLLWRNERDLDVTLGAFADSTKDGSVFVLNTDGKILYGVGQGSTDSLLNTVISDDAMDEIRIADDGNCIVLNSVGFESDPYDMYYATPVYEGGTLYCCILVAAQSAHWTELIGLMRQSTLIAILWVALAASIIVYFLTRRVVDPLKSMSKAAKSFAAGNFDVRVPVRGHDEIADLATAFNQMADSLKNLENMRNNFVSNVSHELRTPMTTISGFIDEMIDGIIGPDKQMAYLKLVSEEVKRLSRLVTTLLELSRMEAGKRKFVMKPFNVCEMARQILISFEQKIDSKKLQVEFLCDEDDLYANADYDAIYQILYNLCDNAIKFSNESGVLRIAIASRAKEKKVIVTVYDEGIGISPEDLPLVFDRFYKSDKSRSLDKTGMGLGLYIAKTTIDAHGEQIWVNSEYGKNCEFGFSLPAVPAPERHAAYKPEENI